MPRHIVGLHSIASKAWFLVAEVGVSWSFQSAQTLVIHLRLGKGFSLVDLGEEQLLGQEEAEEEV